MVVSLVLAVPPLLVFAAFPGPIAFLAGAVFGICSDASLSVTLVAAQRLMPGRTGIASGMILGIGFITGGIGVPLTGLLADAVGIQAAIAGLSVLCLAGAAIGFTIPARALEARAAEGAEAEVEPATARGDRVRRPAVIAGE
jgi:FSR family fosmidomycin resistance protein-like MFS transporter